MRNHDVDVSGTHGVAVHEGEQVPRGAVLRQAVGGGVEAVEVVAALRVGAELATQVVGGLVVRVLEVVLAVGRRLPDVEDGAGDRLARGHVADHTVHLGDAALGGHAVLDDAAAELAEGRVGRPEGAQDGGGCGVDVALRDDLVGDLVNEAGELVSRVIPGNAFPQKKKSGILTTRGRECHRCGGTRYGSGCSRRRCGPRR